MARLPKSIIAKYGISKKAWAVFRGKNGRKGKTSMARKKSSRTRRAYAGAKRVSHRARGMFGGLGLGNMKQIAVGTAGLIAAKRFQPFGGQYKPALDKIALGFILPKVGMGNQDFLTVGVKEALATLADSYLGGNVSTGSTGGSL